MKFVRFVPAQELFKEIGSKRMSEQEIIDTCMTEAWPSSILQLPNRYKLSRSLLEQLKIIEDKGTHRIELTSFPETRLMQIIIPADRDKGYENDIVLGWFFSLTLFVFFSFQPYRLLQLPYHTCSPTLSPCSSLPLFLLFFRHL